LAEKVSSAELFYEAEFGLVPKTSAKWEEKQFSHNMVDGSQVQNLRVLLPHFPEHLKRGYLVFAFWKTPFWHFP
jgi:hypothetical protein